MSNMSLEKLLINLEASLELKYELLGEAKKRLAMTDDIFSQTTIKQRIREEVLPQILAYQSEYWKLISQLAQASQIEESDAEQAIAEVIQGFESIDLVKYPDPVIELLREIKEELNRPGTPATAKAKLALPIVPGLLAYELELDTESSFRQILQPLRKLFRSVGKKK